MIKDIWLNLPAKDLLKTQDFFEKIGFRLNEEQTNDSMVCFQAGEKNTTILFFDEEVFTNFTQEDVNNAGCEVLISFDAASREEIDEMARKVFEAGGTIFSPPGEIEGWMYGFGFIDPNGHRWNQLFMDFAKLKSN